MAHPNTITSEQSKKDSFSHETIGEKLERQMWEDAKALNFKALEKRISPSFQSIHLDGARNNVGELSLIKNLKLGKYTLSNFKSTNQDDTVVVTYTISVDETIDDRHLSHKPTYRMSVWKKNHEGEWQWIAHANLISLGAHQ